MPLVSVAMIKGKSPEYKKTVLEITDNLGSSLGIAAEDVFIVMNEPPLDNWGIGGKQKV